MLRKDSFRMGGFIGSQFLNSKIRIGVTNICNWKWIIYSMFNGFVCYFKTVIALTLFKFKHIEKKALIYFRNKVQTPKSILIN